MDLVCLGTQNDGRIFEVLPSLLSGWKGSDGAEPGFSSSQIISAQDCASFCCINNMLYDGLVGSKEQDSPNVEGHVTDHMGQTDTPGPA